MIKQGMNILEQNEKKRLDFNTQLQQINFLDRRVYKRGEGVYYPSVTTIPLIKNFTRTRKRVLDVINESNIIIGTASP